VNDSQFGDHIINYTRTRTEVLTQESQCSISLTVTNLDA